MSDNNEDRNKKELLELTNRLALAITGLRYHRGCKVADIEHYVISQYNLEPEIVTVGIGESLQRMVRAGLVDVEDDMYTLVGLSYQDINQDLTSKASKPQKSKRRVKRLAMKRKKASRKGRPKPRPKSAKK